MADPRKASIPLWVIGLYPSADGKSYEDFAQLVLHAPDRPRDRDCLAVFSSLNTLKLFLSTRPQYHGTTKCPPVAAAGMRSVLDFVQQVNPNCDSVTLDPAFEGLPTGDIAIEEYRKFLDQIAQ